MIEEPEGVSSPEPAEVPAGGDVPMPPAGPWAAVPVERQLTTAVPPPIPPAPVRPTSAGGLDLLVALGVIWGVELVLGFLVGASAGLAGGTVDPTALFVVMVISGAVTLLISWSRVCRKYGKSFREGFVIRPVSRRMLLVSLLIGVGTALVAAAVVTTFGKNHSLLIQEDHGPAGLAMGMILLLALPPVEEIYYRGFIFPVIRKGLGAPAAVFLVTLWFTAAHWVQFVLEWIAIPVILVIAVIFTVERQVTRSLVPSMVTHWTYNATLVAVTLAMEIASHY